MQVRIEDDALPSFLPDDSRSRELWEWTKQVYRLRQFRPAWFSQSGAGPNTDAALQTLENSSAEGLHPDDFDLSRLRSSRASFEQAPNSSIQNEFDLHLTYSVVSYITQLCFGRVDPREINPDWPASERSCDVPRIAFDAIEQGSLGSLANQLSPRLPEYQGLREAVRRYRDIAAQGGWQPLPPEVAKKPDPQANAGLLSANLARLGDLESPKEGSGVSPASLKDALRRFQSRHGLNADARLNEKTAHAMNASAEERIAQIEMNMDRMRWFPDSEPRYARVNVPGFQLSVKDGDDVPLQMRVIVGSMENRTPLLSSKIEQIVFSPYWNIPLSIATKELLPKIKKDPRYLQREEIEVVRIAGDKVQIVDPSRIDWHRVDESLEYQLRQKPGATNALGLVKFIFPNQYNVYLHDTPTDNLFDRLTRTLSHGCIRVERPTELATYLLRDQPEWTPRRVDEAMHAEKEKHLPLKSPLPIHLVYWTAWADQDGLVQFREDIYGYDEEYSKLISRT
jgi:murein L,D-transpeptidase YcbB/YkuD